MAVFPENVLEAFQKALDDANGSVRTFVLRAANDRRKIMPSDLRECRDRSKASLFLRRLVTLVVTETASLATWPLGLTQLTYT
jgi:hypothetical protein